MQRPPFRPTVHHRMAAFEQAPLTFIAQFTQAVGSSASLTPSASACDRSKRRRFGCRRTAKLRELTCGGCLSAAPWRGASYDARRRLLRAQVAPKDSLREAFGDAGCRARFFPSLFVVQQKGRSPAGAKSRHLREAQRSHARRYAFAAPRPQANPANRQLENTHTRTKQSAKHKQKQNNPSLACAVNRSPPQGLSPKA